MRRLLIIFLVCIYPLTGYGQERESFNLTGGIGIPELINIGGRFQINQTELGFNAGTFPSADEEVFSLQANLLYHFGGSTAFSARRPWYIRSSFTYSRSDTEFELAKYLFLDLRIGRDLNFSDNFGVQIDIGPAYVISEDITEKKAKENTWFLFDIDLDQKVIPIVGITFFYRI